MAQLIIATIEMIFPLFRIFPSSTNKRTPGPNRLLATIRSYMRLLERRKANAAMIQKIVVGNPGRNIPSQPRPKAAQPIAAFSLRHAIPPELLPAWALFT